MRCVSSLVLLLPVLACSGATGDATGDAGGPPPDLLLVSIDTLRPDHLGLHGYARDTSPHLDALARECVVFERAYTTWSWTLPAHASMLTGLYPGQHGVDERDEALPTEVTTVAEVLREAGYLTLGFYRGPGWMEPLHGLEQGFDLYQEHSTVEEALEHVRAALSDAPAGQPVFLFLHLFDVHSSRLRGAGPPYQAPAPFAGCFMADGARRVEGLDKYELFKRDGSGVSAEQHEAIVALYDEGIRHVDARLGEWLEELRAQGRLERAALVITADHGEGLRQHDKLYGGHGHLWEEGLRVPLLLRLPGGRLGGTRVAHTVSLVDIVPTLLEQAGLEPEARIAGRGLLAPQDQNRLLFASDRGAEAVIHGAWKLVEREAGDVALHRLDLDPQELDVQRVDLDDPGEVTDLLERAQAVRTTWWRAGTRKAGASLRTEEALEALGYGGGD